jgi:hypothetical protein
MRLLRPLFLLWIAAWLKSCASNEPPVDLREKVAGTYTYTKTTYHNLGISSSKGILHILSDDTEGKLLLTEEETFYGAALNATDSLFAFYIPQQTIMDNSGRTPTLHGVSNVKVGEIRCDAGYFPNDNRLHLYYKVNYEFNPSQNYSVSLVAIKAD